MTDLDQLLASGATILDPENMTGELLFSRLMSLLTLNISGAKKDEPRARDQDTFQRGNTGGGGRVVALKIPSLLEEATQAESPV